MQDSVPTNSITKPKPRKSLRLRKKRFIRKSPSDECLPSCDLLPLHDAINGSLSLNKQCQSVPDGKGSELGKNNNDMLMYSSLLRELCNKFTNEDKSHNRTAIGGIRSNKKIASLYSPLDQDSLLYPYANLLLGLHKKVAASHRQTPKQQHKISPDRSLSRIMNDFKCPIDPNANEYKINCDNDQTNSYTKKMQNFVILEALRKTLLGECESPSSGCNFNSDAGVLTVSELMSNMGQQQDRKLNPSDDFYYSSLLLKACSAHNVDQTPDFDMVSNSEQDDTDGNISYSDDRDCSSSSKSSDSYEEWSPAYRKRKVRKVRRRSTKIRQGVHKLSVPTSASSCETAINDTHQNKAPTLLKLLLSKESSYNATNANSLPPPPFNAVVPTSHTSQSSSANTNHGSLLKNFLSKPSDEFQKYYSNMREKRENSSPRTLLTSDSDYDGLHGQSHGGNSTNLGVSNLNKKETCIPDLIPCSLLSETSGSFVTGGIKSEANEVDIGSTFLEEHEGKPVPQAMSLTVASMLCRLNLYPSGDGGATTGDLIAPCSASVSCGEDKPNIEMGGEEQCRSTDKDPALEEHQCSLCHLPFISSLDLQCHHSLFHATHSSEKLRN